MRFVTLACLSLALGCSDPVKDDPADPRDTGEPVDTDTGGTDTGGTDTGGNDTGTPDTGSTDTGDTAHTGETGDTGEAAAPPPSGGHFCAAAGTMTGGGYVAVTCTAPVDAASGTVATGGGYTWQPGPVVRLAP